MQRLILPRMLSTKWESSKTSYDHACSASQGVCECFVGVFEDMVTMKEHTGRVQAMFELRSSIAKFGGIIAGDLTKTFMNRE